jgi:hypothetical protein
MGVMGAGRSWLEVRDDPDGRVPLIRERERGRVAGLVRAAGLILSQVDPGCPIFCVLLFFFNFCFSVLCY